MENKRNKEPIYLDNEGHKELLNRIEQLKEKITNNNMQRKEAFDAGAGDGWDTPEFEEIERINTRLNGELRNAYDELSRVIIVEKHNNQDIVDIGDTIIIDRIMNPENSVEMTFKLVGGAGNMNTEIQEVSINSPIGKTVYKKNVGDICEFSVNDRKFSLLIKQKLNLTKENNESVKKMIKKD